MVEDDEAGVEAQMAVRQFQVVDRPARQAGFDELFQVVTPVAETAAQRKRHVHLVGQLKACEQRR